MSSPNIDEMERLMASKGKEVRRDLRQIFLAGLALTVPFFITLIVLVWVLNLVSNALTPLVASLVELNVMNGIPVILIEVVALLIVFGLVFVVGLAAQHGPDTNLSNRIDVLMEDLPGLGSIYTSVERMSDVLLEGDTESFQEVKLVEFPHEDSYSIAFLTAKSPTIIEENTGTTDMLTVYVPLAPNPVMGGHLLTLPSERVIDVDLSVEEGMQAIITMGIAIAEEKSSS